MTDEPRVLTLVYNEKLYLVAEGRDDGDRGFVSRTGLTAEQFVADLLGQITYRFGADNSGAMRGSIVNQVMPLCDKDLWERSDDRTPRTWHTEDHGYRFYPYTAGDVSTIMRCGRPVVYLERHGERFFAAMSPGQDGFEVLSSADVLQFVDARLAATNVEVVRDRDELLGYINEKGHLTF